MAKIDFPPASSSPFSAPNGVIYTYIGTEPNGYWSGTDTDGSASLKFVEVAGDNMTGDLTLGTDKITLDATAGSAEFKGDGPEYNYQHKLINTSSSEFAGVLRIEGSGGNNQQLISASSGIQVFGVKGDGSGAFVGKVTSASTEDTDPDNTLVTKGYFDANGGGDGTGVEGTIGYWNRTGTDLSPVNAGDTGTFAGGVRATGNSSGTWTSGSGWEILSTGINAYDRSANQYIAGEINTLNWNIKGDGSATFSGTVRVNQATDYFGTDGNTLTMGGTNGEKVKIAAGGSAEFAGRTVVGAWRAESDNVGGVVSYPSGGISLVRPSGTNGESFTIYDGPRDNTANKKIALSSDGSGEFAGVISTGGASSSGMGASGGRMRHTGDISLRKDGGTAAVLEVFQNGDGTADKKVIINNDGSAEFSGTGIFGGDADNGANTGIRLASAGAVAACRAAGNNAVFSGYTEGNSTPQMSLYADGSGSFSGTITAGGYSMASLAQL